ncbi:hypothetical protein MTBPR1_60026 [Candidatus Terasakiella magnetica]|uniref:PPM-type phosphatase domain-containing protein n=1 Tax=Candidatus Terasakiella magnetica TaxID=1867952 RepID=A0A1C3RJW3_9PROT|nr:SpoIIE family protein phosphatase [Candidatus Terasakiella magnetica]SCA57513.1 hypothetical protein MTBPR1_60026 [Candidatus Terasakiella magnetica]
MNIVCINEIKQENYFYIMFRSLTVKTLSIFIPLVLIAEICVFSVQSWYHYKEQERELLNRLENLATVQSSSLAQFLWEYDDESVAAAIQQMTKLPIIKDAVIYNDTGEIVIANGQYENAPEKPSYRIRKDIVYVEQADNRKIGELVVTVTGQNIVKELYNKLKITLIVSAVLLFALIGATLLSNRLFIGRPLGLLKKAIDTQKDDLTKQSNVDWHSNDEIGDVVSAFNQMQDRQTNDRNQIEQYQDHLEDLVNQRTAEVHAGIKYASRIQRSILPSKEMLNSATQDHFIIWEPRDLVGGDFYWCRRWGKGYLIILGDCTGHGVPGALMTLVCAGVMDRAESETELGDYSALMQRIHILMRRALSQDGQNAETDDGVELGLCFIPDDRKHLHFVGARIDLYKSENGEISTIKGTRVGIGYPEISEDQLYEKHIIPIEGNEIFYMTSDGFVDQIGGPKRTMYGKRRFKDFLNRISTNSLSMQSQSLCAELKNHQGTELRRDDISLVGFKVN